MALGALSLKLRSLRESPAGSGKTVHVIEDAGWPVVTTAALICDMWDDHWCRDASRRVTEMAPRMNALVFSLRTRGVLVVHCPSETMGFYADHPGRAVALAAPPVEVGETGRAASITAKAGPLPIDDSDGGCDCSPKCPSDPPYPWKRQHPGIQIAPGDPIGDGKEVLYVLAQRGVRHAIIMGVHANMCVLDRTFGIRNLVDKGYEVALVRDLTDTMYDPRMPPRVDHFTGTDLVIWHIERHWARTFTSDQLLGGAPFRFREDHRKVLPVP